ncbi:hypothetical protein OEZ86_001306 [Tetradesmus obliquus]|nr:hypothetical protein OEZ86_001306 [Tetradesmus obliquus]
MASEAAYTIPALAAITSSVSVAAASSGIEVVGHTSYSTVLRGAALQTRSAADAQRLKEQLQQNPAVHRVWYAGARRLVEPILPGNVSMSSVHLASTPAAASTASATNGNAAATGLAKALSNTRASGGGSLDGSGTLVCVVDTGINFSNDIYGNCYGVNQPPGQCKVVTGYDFVGDAYNGRLDGPPAVRGGPPVDCMGHGSMVASVAATANGVAPGAQLGSYRVFGCSGYAVDDVIIEAIDRAVRDGCDVINLSLASGSGFASTSVYSSVMRNALRQGVLVVKAAGNSGEDGPFTADVFTAVGAISAASVGDDVLGLPLDASLVASRFSSYGPNPSLLLAPHVAAPGAFIPVVTMHGSSYRASGTSFASPYIAGVLALWLQAQQQQAAHSGRPLAAAEASQAAALRGLVSTAKGVRSDGNSSFLEPVAKLGAGVIQVDALLANQLRVTPYMLSLPSNISQPTTLSINLTWDPAAAPAAAAAAAAPAAAVTYSVQHEPAAAITVSNGWYGSARAIEYVYQAADVRFNSSKVAVNTSAGAQTELKVTFSLPPALASQPLLYSGLIKLQPTDPSLPPVVIPYQGFSQDWSGLRILAKPNSDLSPALAATLRAQQNALCYAPRSQPQIASSIIDQISSVPDVCSGGFAAEVDQQLNVSLAVLQESPECSLRVTLAPEVPLHTLFMDVLDAAGRLLGSMAPLDTSSGSSLASVGEVPSFCLRFNGSFRGRDGGLTWLRPGNVYRLRARLRGPLAAGDLALQRRPSKQVVFIKGKFRVGA